MTKALVVEPKETINNQITDALKRHKIFVESIHLRTQATEKILEFIKPDLIFLDIEDNRAFAEAIKKKAPEIPIIFLTEKNSHFKNLQLPNTTVFQTEPFDQNKFIKHIEEITAALRASIVEKLLKNAPVHIKEPQIKELEELPLEKLKSFLDIQSLPLTPKKRKTLIKKVGKNIVDRLEKRKMLADAIAKAESKGLYEIEEHKTGMQTL